MAQLFDLITDTNKSAVQVLKKAVWCVCLCSNIPEKVGNKKVLILDMIEFFLVAGVNARKWQQWQNCSRFHSGEFYGVNATRWLHNL